LQYVIEYFCKKLIDLIELLLQSSVTIVYKYKINTSVKQT